MEIKPNSSSPDRSPLDELAHKNLLELVNKAGNRTLKTTLKHPFPIVKASMDRMNEVISNMPPDVQKSAGVMWMKIDAVLEGMAREVGVGVADTIWDAVTLPINIFVPELRHPNFKKTMAQLYTPPIVGKTYGDQIRLWYTPSGGSKAAMASDASVVNKLLSIPVAPRPRILSA